MFWRDQEVVLWMANSMDVQYSSTASTVSNTKTKTKEETEKLNLRPGAKISLSSFQIQLLCFLPFLPLIFKGFRSGSFRILENNNKSKTNKTKQLEKKNTADMLNPFILLQLEERQLLRKKRGETVSPSFFCKAADVCNMYP